MVASLYRDHIVAARERPSRAKCEFVGFAAGVHEQTHAKRIREECGQSLGIQNYVVVEIARVCVESLDLFPRRLDHFRVAVADVANIVYAVQAGDTVTVRRTLVNESWDAGGMVLVEAGFVMGPVADDYAGREIPTFLIDRY